MNRKESEKGITHVQCDGLVSIREIPGKTAKVLERIFFSQKSHAFFLVEASSIDFLNVFHDF